MTTPSDDDVLQMARNAKCSPAQMCVLAAIVGGATIIEIAMWLGTNRQSVYKTRDRAFTRIRNHQAQQETP